MQFAFTDAVPVSGLRKTRDGYAVAEVRAARIGVQDYSGLEVGRPELPTVSVYRPPESVFAADSLASYGFKPVTINHPADGVTADTWKSLAVGIVGGDVVRDGGFVKVPLALMDAAGIKAVEDGTREISMGYLCDLVFEDGVTPEGQTYQAIQKDIRINHLALVPKGRAGPHCRIGDQGFSDPVPQPQAHGDQPMADNLRAVTVDSVTYQMNDQGAQLIERLQGLLRDAGASLETQKGAHDAALAAKDAELAKKDAEIDDLKTKVIDGTALDALVAERAAVVSKAKALDAKVVTDGKTNAEIKRAVLGDAAKDKSDAYVDAAFDLKTADLKAGDPLRDTITDGITADAADKAVNDARAEYLKSLNPTQAAAA